MRKIVVCVLICIFLFGLASCVSYELPEHLLKATTTPTPVLNQIVTDDGEECPVGYHVERYVILWCVVD